MAKLYLGVQELTFDNTYTPKAGVNMLEGWVNKIEVGMVYRDRSKFIKLETQEQIDELQGELMSGKVIKLDRKRGEDEQLRLVKVHIVLDGVQPKRGEYFTNCFMGNKPELYKHDTDYGIFDPGDSVYDDKVVLRHEEMKDPAEVANSIIDKYPQCIDDRNKFDGEIKDGELIFL
jgi:hypothetical protein